MSDAPPPLSGDPADTTQLALERGIRAARRGQAEAARKHLEYVIRQEPENELALMWLVQVAATPQAQWEYLNLIAAAHPENQWAQQQMQALQAGQVVGLGARGVAAAAAAPGEPRRLFGELRIRELKCPSCGGACAIHGDEVKTVVCRFCETTLALEGEAMRALNAPKPRGTPSEPIKPGMECQFGGTKYLVIGWIRFKGWDAEESWTWEEWLLAGEDKSYAWLQKDDNGWQFYTRLPIKHKLNPRADRIPVPGGHARVVERAPAEILCIQGALTWRAQIGDTLTYVDARKGGKTYSMEYTEKEIELLTGSPLDEEVLWSAMGHQALAAAAGAVRKRRSGAFFGCAASFLVALLLVLALGGGLALSGRGTPLIDQSISVAPGTSTTTESFAFTNSRPHKLTVDVNGLQPGETAAATVALLGSDGQTYAVRMRSSRSGSRHRLSATFRPPRGNFRLQFGVATAEHAIDAQVRIYRGVWLARYFFYGLLLVSLMGVINLLRLGKSTA